MAVHSCSKWRGSACNKTNNQYYSAENQFKNKIFGLTIIIIIITKKKFGNLRIGSFHVGRRESILFHVCVNPRPVCRHSGF
jgi:hypothetical protein